MELSNIEYRQTPSYVKICPRCTCQAHPTWGRWVHPQTINECLSGHKTTPTLEMTQKSSSGRFGADLGPRPARRCGSSEGSGWLYGRLGPVGKNLALTTLSGGAALRLTCGAGDLDLRTHPDLGSARTPPFWMGFEAAEFRRSPVQKSAGFENETIQCSDLSIAGIPKCVFGQVICWRPGAPRPNNHSFLETVWGLPPPGPATAIEK